MKLQTGIEYFDKTSFFQLKRFSKACKKFSVGFANMFKVYLKGAPNLDLSVSEKIVTSRRTNRIIWQEKWQKLRFWKLKLQNGIEYSDIHVNFWWWSSTFWA